MAKAGGNNQLSNAFTGKGRKIAEVVEYLAASPNATSNAISQSTGADPGVVSSTRRLVRRAAGKNAHFDQLPSVKSRGVPRQLYTALELLGLDPQASSADVADSAGISRAQVDSIKNLVKKAKESMV